jgi:hypothetical protein
VDRFWWASWTSNPVWGVKSVPGGFDSHAPPPLIYGAQPVPYVIIFPKVQSNLQEKRLRGIKPFYNQGGKNEKRYYLACRAGAPGLGGFVRFRNRVCG